MTQSGLSPIELLAIQYGIMSGIFPAQTVDVCAESYTVRDRRTGRALYTESGWLFHDELPTSVSDALAKYTSLESARIEQLRSARQDGPYAGLKPSFADDAAKAKAALLAAIKAAM